jgi:uncharacterized protein
MFSFVGGALTGLGFGIVLYKVGATRYSRIMGMLTLRDTKVMKFAFTGIGVSSLIYGLAAALGLSESWGLVPRVMPFLGTAHLVGGALFGASMGVSGLCPGTCVAKAGGRGGDKKWVSTFATLGLFAGVLIYSQLATPLTDVGIIAANPKPLTLHGMLGLPYAATSLISGAAFILLACAIDRFTTERVYEPVRVKKTLLDQIRGEWSWAAAGTIGGLLIAGATAQGGYLGFSGAVLALTGWIGHLIGAPLELVPRVDADLIWRAALIIGVLPGGMLAHVFSLPSKAAAAEKVERTLDPKAIAKSFSATTVMSLGAMIGGGCTTGAFISAWSTLSIGSFAMAGTFFVVSMAVGNARLLALKTLDLAGAQAVGDKVYD